MTRIQKKEEAFDYMHPPFRLRKLSLDVLYIVVCYDLFLIWKRTTRCGLFTFNVMEEDEEVLILAIYAHYNLPADSLRLMPHHAPMLDSQKVCCYFLRIRHTPIDIFEKSEQYRFHVPSHLSFDEKSVEYRFDRI